MEPLTNEVVQSWIYFLEWFGFGLFMLTMTLAMALLAAKVIYEIVIAMLNFLWDISMGGKTWKKLMK